MENLQIYSPEYYSKLYEMEDTHWWCLGMREIAAAVLDPLFSGSTAIRVLDAGCGTGMFLNWLNRYAKRDQIIGIDISMQALQYCKVRHAGNICQSSITKLSFASDSFDLITCSDVLQHVPSMENAAFAELLRVLKRDGILYLRTNARQKFVVNEDPAKQYHRYCHEEVIQRATECGFHLIYSTFANAWPSVLSDAKNFFQGRKHELDGHEHRSAYQGLEMRIPPFGLNKILYAYMKREARYLSNHKNRLTFGHSIVFLLQKKDLQK